MVFNFNVIELDSQHGVGFHEQVLPPNVLVNTTSDASKLDGSDASKLDGMDVVRLHVQE